MAEAMAEQVEENPVLIPTVRGTVTFEDSDEVVKFMTQMAREPDHMIFADVRFLGNSIKVSNDFCEKFGQQVKGLEIWEAENFNVVLQIVNKVPNVERLEINNLGMLGPASMPEVSAERLEKLKEFSISYCDADDPAGSDEERNWLSPDLSAFLSLQAPTLDTLRLRRRAEDDIMDPIKMDAPILPKLKSLSLDMGAEEVIFPHPTVTTFPRLKSLEVKLSAGEDLTFIFEGFKNLESLTLVEIDCMSRDGIDYSPAGLGEALVGYGYSGDLPIGGYETPYPFGVRIDDPEYPNVIHYYPPAPRASLRNLERLKHFELISSSTALCPCSKLNCFGALLALGQMKTLESVKLQYTLLRKTTIKYLKTQIKSVVIAGNDSATSLTWNRDRCQYNRHSHYSAAVDQE